MPTSSEAVEYFRLFLRGQPDVGLRLDRYLSDHGWNGLPALFGAALVVAVRRRFAAEDYPSIIRFVADLRAEGGPDTYAIDPGTAETLIRHGLGAVNDVHLAQPEMLSILQVMIVEKVVRDAQLTDAELDQLLADAKALADSAKTI